MSTLKDKVVLITGASSGFGAVAAKQFVQEGCKIILAARRIDRLEDVANQIYASGGDTLPVAVDVTQPAQIDALVKAAMYKQGSGHIINMSSLAGWAAPPLYTVYSAAKFGVRGFTEALRREAAPFGVKVSAIYPGRAATEFQTHIGRNKAKKRFKTPTWLSLSADDVARAAVHLAKRPRRSLILPWMMMFSLIANSHLAGLSDLVQTRAFAPYYQEDMKKTF